MKVDKAPVRNLWGREAMKNDRKLKRQWFGLWRVYMVGQFYTRKLYDANISLVVAQMTDELTIYGKNEEI